MELAVLTFEDPPVRTRVAKVACPLDQNAVALDDLETMRTSRGHSHDCRRSMGQMRPFSNLFRNPACQSWPAIDRGSVFFFCWQRSASEEPDR